MAALNSGREATLTVAAERFTVAKQHRANTQGQIFRIRKYGGMSQPRSYIILVPKATGLGKRTRLACWVRRLAEHIATAQAPKARDDHPAFAPAANDTSVRFHVWANH